jgi:transcription-repair coupling factor (superfamily II helicase)
VVDLPIDAHLPDGYVPDEAQKLELYRRLARTKTASDVAAFRQELIDRFGPMPAPVLRLVEVAALRLAADSIGIASMSREEGQLVVRFGNLPRSVAMRALAGQRFSGVPVGGLTFASNQVRIRLPKDPGAAWGITQAVVTRLVAAATEFPTAAP